MVIKRTQKTYHLDSIIPNDSCHPPEQKLAAIRYFVNRINTYDLSHENKQKRNKYNETDHPQ